MHLIISILIGILFTALVAKALIETFWGLCLIAYGYGCNIIAAVLRGLAKLVRLMGKTRQNKHIPEPRRVSVATAWANCHR